MSRLTELFERAKQIFQTEGLIPLVRWGFTFGVRRFFQYRRYHFYEEDIEALLRERNEANFLPGIENFTIKIVSTNEQADELAAEGLEV